MIVFLSGKYHKCHNIVLNICYVLWKEKIIRYSNYQSIISTHNIYIIMHYYALWLNLRYYCKSNYI